MTNDLNNFLEERYNRIYNGETLDSKKEDTRLINFVLDLVEKEVGKLYEPYEGEEQIMIENHMLDKVSIIIKQLRV